MENRVSRTAGKKHTMPGFAAMTADVDQAIGAVLDKVEALGIKETTYVFFLSENGCRRRQRLTCR